MSDVLFVPNMTFVESCAKLLRYSRKQMADALGMTTEEYRSLRTGGAVTEDVVRRLDDIIGGPMALICPVLAEPVIEPVSAHWVYRCFDAAGQALYVGCTGNLRRRLYQHQRSASWASDVAKVKATVHRFRSEALEVEVAEIHRLDPAHNVHNKRRHLALVEDAS